MAEPKAPLSVEILRSFDRDVARLPKNIREKAGEQIERLAARQFDHPSLGFKKMEGAPDIWEARVTRNYRMTLHLTRTEIILRRIGTHNVLRRP